MRNPPKEGDFAGNYELIDKESTRGMGFYRELPAYLLGFRLGNSHLACHCCSYLKLPKGKNIINFYQFPTGNFL
jgi:hypothetical protein